MTPEEIKEIGNRFRATIWPCGSRVTCNPAPTGTDADYLVLVNCDADLSLLTNHLGCDGWLWEGDEHYQTVASNGFMSWRKGEANLIITKSMTFAERHRAATHICRALNLMSKQDRIMVFQAVLYSNCAADATSVEQTGSGIEKIFVPLAKDEICF